MASAIRIVPAVLGTVLAVAAATASADEVVIGPTGPTSSDLCESETVAVYLNGSICPCAFGSTLYRVEEAGVPLPGCDWNPSPRCDIPPYTLSPGLHVLSALVWCPATTCQNGWNHGIEITANEPPPSLGNVLRLSGDGDTVWLTWAASAATSYRVWRDAEPWVDLATRQMLDLPSVDPGALSDATAPPAYYQLVALSCAGDLESPY